MNKSITFVLITSLIIINATLYIKFVIYDNNTLISLCIKWIPAFLLCIQTIILSNYYNFSRYNKIQYKYTIFLIISFIFCMIGDLLLIFDKYLFFIIGMIMFGIAYLLFGIGRLCQVKKYLINFRLLYAGIFLTTVIQITYTSYIIYLSRYNPVYDNIPFIAALIIYSTIINFSICCNYVHLLSVDTVNNSTLSAWLSFIGVILFTLSDCILIIYQIKYTYNYIESISVCLYWIGLLTIGRTVYHVESYNVLLY